jgi:L-alanine-DL-glutamate epimerase-like enolase superfamily enzyme
MKLGFRSVDWEYVSVFRIAYRARTHARTVLVELQDDDSGLVGRGEALGVSYRGEDVDTLLAELAKVASSNELNLSPAGLQEMMPAGGARNALDCALWDLEAKRIGRRAWQLAGFQSVRPLTTAYTLGLDTPEAMALAAAAAKQYSLLKIKLCGEDDLQRVTLIRQTRPDARLIVDANQAWHEQQLAELTPRFAELGVILIEQPLPVGKDDALIRFRSPIPLCADESCQTSESLAAVCGKYQYANIKLDKTGGLTEALRLAQLARSAGLKLMVGCMGGSSLSMAPAFIVGQLCELVDLDGPLLLKSDVPDSIHYDGNEMSAPQAALWG